ncbi:DUF6503 family protein [Aquimarina pacifica]|uniref:DUF6503 family protein n=1 Tax=Aquimarina pacifica TaxID=1296415 RepID=UPI00046EA809|nr:DUF6503 family protein [Aquimarina pacifica]
MKNGFKIFICVITLTSCIQHQNKSQTKSLEKTTISQEIDTDSIAAKRIISKMVNKVGTMQKLRDLKNVEYTYTFRMPEKGIEDISKERYIFDGELSWAQYNTHQIYVFPSQKGTVIQGFDGHTSWTTLGGISITDPEAVNRSEFLRKTNFYWFTMMSKLLDTGLKYELLEDRILNGITYKIVKITFEENIGDVQDDYVLYVNPQTHLVDQFLFTVREGGFMDPLLMNIEYDIVNGIYIMAKRSVTRADWNGNKKGEAFIEQVSENILFTTNIDHSLFKAPVYTTK